MRHEAIVGHGGEQEPAIGICAMAPVLDRVQAALQSAVEPPEDDSDAAILEAVRLVLEKDPFVDATRIRAGVRSALVRLTGAVPSAAERAMAEADAWYVFGVDKVDNRIEVDRTGTSG
jgi:osmotically-inducible protein OsmY